MPSEVQCGEIPCTVPSQIVRCEVVGCQPVQCGALPCDSEGVAAGFAYNSDDLSLEQ